MQKHKRPWIAKTVLRKSTVFLVISLIWIMFLKFGKEKGRIHRIVCFLKGCETEVQKLFFLLPVLFFSFPHSHVASVSFWGAKKIIYVLLPPIQYHICGLKSFKSETPSVNFFFFLTEVYWQAILVPGVKYCNDSIFVYIVKWSPQ